MEEIIATTMMHVRPLAYNIKLRRCGCKRRRDLPNGGISMLTARPYNLDGRNNRDVPKQNLAFGSAPFLSER